MIRKSLRRHLALLIVFMLCVPWVAFASEVDVAVVDIIIPVDSVILEPGASSPIVINLSVTGQQAGTATFKVNRDWVLSETGVFIGSNPQEFTVAPRGGGDLATTFSTSGSVSVAAGVTADTYSLTVVAFDITNSNSTGAKLSAGDFENYYVIVEMLTVADETAPTVEILTGPSSWQNTGSATFTWLGTDETTAEADLVYSYKLNGGDDDWSGYSVATTITLTNIPEGLHTFYIRSMDEANNVSSVATRSFGVDITKPNLLWESFSPAPNAYGWNNTVVSVFYSVNDNLSGIASSTPSSPLTFTTEGAGMTQSVTVTDNAGNSEQFTSPEVSIDWTAPVVTATAYSAANVNNWYNTNVIVTFTATDTLSGVDALDNPVTVTTEGATQVISGNATDKAGNTGTGSITLNIDKTKPTVEITLPSDGIYLLNASVPNATWIASDSLSGLATPAAGSEAIDTSTVGQKSITVTSTDNAGNVEIKTTTYYVNYVFGGFLKPISSDNSSIFKHGSTIPVKFQLQDNNEVFLHDPLATISIRKVTDGLVGGDYEDVVSTSAATTGTLFRYDAQDQQHVFNLGTKNLLKNCTYSITVTLGDGTQHSICFGLK